MNIITPNITFKSFEKSTEVILNITFKNLNSGDKFFHIEKDNKYSHGIYVNESYIIFATLNVFKPTNEINEVFKEIIKMAKQYEGNLFVSMK